MKPRNENNIDINIINNLMNSDIIAHGFINSISIGNWNVKRFKMKRSGITEVLNIMTYISALCQITRIISQFIKTKKK